MTAAKDAFVTGMTQCATVGAITLAAVTALAACHMLRTRDLTNAAATAGPAPVQWPALLLGARSPIGIQVARRHDGRHLNLTLALRFRTPVLWALATLPLLAAPWLRARRQAHPSPKRAPPRLRPRR